MYQKKEYNYYYIDDYLNMLFSEHPIASIIQNKNKYYNNFYIYKKNGNKRKIEQPLGELMLIQKNISKALLNFRRYYDSSHGFERHRSIYTNALNHTNKETVLNIDLKDFFLNISKRQVLNALSKIEQITERNVRIIADLITINNHLPQGSPTSPIISNFICDELDYNLRVFCKNANITYSRYADDLTFSYDKKNLEKSDYIPIFQIIKEHGFIINYKKFRYFHRNQRQTVTGLTVNEKVNVSRKFHKQLRAILYNWKTKGNNYTQSEIFKINKNKTHFALLIKSYITFYGFIKGRNNKNYLNFVREFNEIVSNNDDEIVRNIGVLKVKELNFVKINNGSLKFAFNFVSKKDSKGNWKTHLPHLGSNKLLLDACLALDADYMHEVSKDSVERPGSVYIEFTEDPKIIDAIDKKNPGFKNSLAKAKTFEEKAMITPAIVTHIAKDGKVRSFNFIHSYGWYTEENTADESTRIEGNENIKQIRLSLANNPSKKQAIQVFTPRAVNYNSFNKHGNGELLPVSTRNKQATVGYARYTNATFFYSNVPENLRLNKGRQETGNTEDRARIVNIDTFENGKDFNKNNPIIFHKVGVNSQGQNLYMINTLLSPYTYAPINEREKNLGNTKLPEDLKRTFEKALLGILLKSKRLNPELKKAIDKIMRLSEQQNKKIQELSTLDMFAKFIRVFQPGASSYRYQGNTNKSDVFKEELRKYKQTGKKATVFREFKHPETKIEESEMAFWDNDAQDYRIINLQTFTTGLLKDLETTKKAVPENFEKLLNQMIEAMSVVNIFATSPTSTTDLITKENGIIEVPTEDIYKELLLTPLVSYEMENAKGETIEVFNIQPVIHFTPIESNGDIKDVSIQSEVQQKQVNQNYFGLTNEDYENPGLSWEESWKLGNTTYTFYMQGGQITGGITSNNAELGYGQKAEKTFEDVTSRGVLLKKENYKFDKQLWEQYKEFRGGRDLSFIGKTTLEKAQEASEQAVQEIENEQENSQIKQLQAKREQFINGLIAKGYTEEKATQMYNAQLRLMGLKPDTEFDSRNNIN